MSDSPATWMLYGATGYTGRLIAREAAKRGQRPVLAGRNRDEIQKLSAELKLPARIFSLGDAETIVPHLTGVRLVLNCAGPFSATAAPLMEACIRAGVHYLDITGEIDVIEGAAERGERARAAGVSLLPAVGFDVVPSDCLARTLADALPTATRLTLAFTGLLGVSPGTAKTAVQGLVQGERARIAGRITRPPAEGRTREIPFRTGTLRATRIPWGDVASAYHSTGVPNITTYMAFPAENKVLARQQRGLAVLARIPLMPRLLQWGIGRWLRGPSEEELRNSHASFWGEVCDDAGGRATATLDTPGGYTLTVLTALAAVDRVLQGNVPPGFATPSMAFGKEFVLSVPGVELGKVVSSQ